MKIYGHPMFASQLNHAVLLEVITDDEAQKLKKWAQYIFAGRRIPKYLEHCDAVNESIAKYYNDPPRVIPTIDPREIAAIHHIKKGSGL